MTVHKLQVEYPSSYQGIREFKGHLIAEYSEGLFQVMETDSGKLILSAITTPRIFATPSIEDR